MNAARWGVFRNRLPAVGRSAKPAIEKGRVESYPTVGVGITPHTTGSGPTFSNNVDIAVEADGNLMVSDALLGAVLRVDPVTGDRTIVSDAATGSGPTFDFPLGIAVEADGFLVVADRDLGAVLRVDPVTGDRTFLSITRVGTEDDALPGASFTLSPGYPNPFRSTITLSFTLAQPEVVQLSIYDALGRQVATLLDGLQSARWHEVRWDAGGHAAGVYLARLQVGDRVLTRRLLLFK